MDTTTQRPAPHRPNKQRTAQYIADVSAGLRDMATGAGMPFLAYLLDMAVEEAFQQGVMPRRRRTARRQKTRPVRAEVT
ncbi:MAG TPA: hypothetical protein VF982_09325 [Anaerolineales bacterium]|jgi:hypothetical protein